MKGHSLRGKQPEAIIRDAMFEYLSRAFPQWLVWRDKQVTSTIRRGVNFPEATGAPDINILTTAGRYIGVEVKRNVKFVASDVQKEFHRKIIKNQGMAFVSSSVEQLQKQMRGVR